VPVQIRDETPVAATTPSLAKKEEDDATPGLGRLEVGVGGPQIGTIDIEIDGVRVRVSGAADIPALRQVLGYLGRRP
jgi:hypothetical protein